MHVADVNGDGVVDQRDLMAVVDALGKKGASRFDISGKKVIEVYPDEIEVKRGGLADGVVDKHDVAAVWDMLPEEERNTNIIPFDMRDFVLNRPKTDRIYMDGENEQEPQEPARRRR